VNVTILRLAVCEEDVQPTVACAELIGPNAEEHAAPDLSGQRVERRHPRQIVAESSRDYFVKTLESVFPLLSQFTKNPET